MNRKLILLDVVLAAGVIFGGFEWHGEWVAARARQAGVARSTPKAATVPPLRPLPEQPAVVASAYKDIAMNDLFDASRNPNVPVEPPPPPPPPKQPPPLPAFRGMMNFGDKLGPVALITLPGEAEYKSVHATETIGEFTLVSFNRQEMVLDWEGHEIHKRIGEAADEAKPRAAAQSVEPVSTNSVIPGQAPPEAAPQQQPQAQLGPGPDMGGGVKACQAGDGSAPGTVQNGYRKDVVATPFGSAQCIWRAVGK